MSEAAFDVNGWSIYAHPLFLDQLEAIIVDVEKARHKDPKGYRKKRAAKLLAAVLKVALEDIPSDPPRDIYRQGDTLGEGVQALVSRETPATIPLILPLSAIGRIEDHRSSLGE